MQGLRHGTDNNNNELQLNITRALIVKTLNIYVCVCVYDLYGAYNYWVGMFNSDIYSDRHSNIMISGYHFRITNIISNVASAKLPLIREHKTPHTRSQWIASD